MMQRRRVIRSMLPLLMLALISCAWSLNSRAQLDDSIMSFQRALNTRQLNSARAVCYNEPASPLLEIVLWQGIRDYRFIDWTSSIHGNEARIVLDYGVTSAQSGNLFSGRQTFAMRKFGSRWLVDLSGFARLD